MTYNLAINPNCQDEIQKACRKNPELEQAIKKKIKQILESPQHYKPLKHDFAGERRVHIMKSFVLKYEIDENTQTVILLFFGHHDEAYVR